MVDDLQSRQPGSRRRVSLAGLISSPRGIRCPNCTAAAEWSVEETRQIVNGVLRIRTCRKCGHRVKTIERANGTPAYQPPSPPEPMPEPLPEPLPLPTEINDTPSDCEGEGLPVETKPKTRKSKARKSTGDGL